jgi:hypothetical protein
VGANSTFRVIALLGFNVAGNVAPDTVKPVPVKAAELMVTGAEPLEVKVTDFLIGVFNATVPNDKLVALRLKDGV